MDEATGRRHGRNLADQASEGSTATTWSVLSDDHAVQADDSDSVSDDDLRRSNNGVASSSTTASSFNPFTAATPTSAISSELE